MKDKLSDKVIILGKDNPYKGKEDDLQMAIVRVLWLRFNKYIWYHVPNGGKRNQKEAAKFKRMGVMAGVSDVIFDEPMSGYHGLRIELKAANGTLSDSQIKFLNKASSRGYLCAVCYSFESTVDIIQKYLNNHYAKPS